MSTLTRFSIYTALALLAICLFSSTANAEIKSVLGERDVVVKLYHDREEQSFAKRLSTRGFVLPAFVIQIRNPMDVNRVHIVYGDADVVCEIFGHGRYGGFDQSRKFSPTLKPIRLDSTIRRASELHCFLPEKKRGKKTGIEVLGEGQERGSIGRP